MMFRKSTISVLCVLFKFIDLADGAEFYLPKQIFLRVSLGDTVIHYPFCFIGIAHFCTTGKYLS